jgi:hypothetical protein
MQDNWTQPLSEEGAREVLREREERPAETPQRLDFLRRVRDAARSLRRGGTRGLINEDR